LIDAHTHILPDLSLNIFKPILSDPIYISLFSNNQAISNSNHLISEMKKNKIDRSVTLGYGWASIEAIRLFNDYNLKASKEFSNQIIPFCSANPKLGSSNVVEIKRALTSGAKGIGEIHPDSQKLDLEDKKLWEGTMNLARESSSPVVIHSSEPVGHSYAGKGNTTPRKLYNFIKMFSENKIILAHWGGGLMFYELMEEVKQLSKNVYYDTAATSFLYNSNIFTVAKNIIGTKKIIFGSDFPLLNPQRILKEFKTMNETEIENITNNNLLALLG
jgi:predicted TIM-barrel fold metal-dependent hydrolase